MSRWKFRRFGRDLDAAEAEARRRAKLDYIGRDGRKQALIDDGKKVP